MSEWTTVFQVVAVPTISAAGAYLVAKKSNKANEKTAEIQDRAEAVEGFDKLVHNLETRLEKVEEANEKLTQRADSLGGRVRILEEERAKDKSLIRHLIAYIQTLRSILRSEGLYAPDAPAGLDLEGGPLAERENP